MENVLTNLLERERERESSKRAKGRKRKTNPLLALLSSLESVFSLLEWPTDQNAGIGRRRRLYLSRERERAVTKYSLSLFSSHWESYPLSLSLRCESETRCVFKCDCSSDEEKGAATIVQTSLVITWWWSLSGQFSKPNAISLWFVNETKVFLWLRLYLSDTLPKETLPKWYFTERNSTWVILYRKKLYLSDTLPKLSDWDLNISNKMWLKNPWLKPWITKLSTLNTFQMIHSLINWLPWLIIFLN